MGGSAKNTVRNIRAISFNDSFIFLDEAIRTFFWLKALIICYDTKASPLVNSIYNTTNLLSISIIAKLLTLKLYIIRNYYDIYKECYY